MSTMIFELSNANISLTATTLKDHIEYSQILLMEKGTERSRSITKGVPTRETAFCPGFCMDKCRGGSRGGGGRGSFGSGPTLLGDP